MDGNYDVIVVGGGHNGLVAAAYLGKAGLKVCVCEAREVVGGAAVSEHPFGPSYTVTSLSYVVSLMSPQLVADLDLKKHGYHVYPQGPYFAPRADGGYLALADDPGERHDNIAKFSARDADAYEEWDGWMNHLGGLLAPLLERIPPKLGSKRPAELARAAGLARQLRGVGVRDAVDITRMMTDSIADLVEDRFESDAMRGLLSVSGCIGTWAGPRSAGTAYVMLHHHVGDIGDGVTGSWGFPRGGMGGVTRALSRAARENGAAIRTAAPVSRINVSHGRATGITLDNGDELHAPIVVTTAHPKISFLKLIDRDELPEDFVADIQRFKTRSGTVKINLAVDKLPTFASHPEFDPWVHGGTIVLAESLDHIEDAYQQAVSGKAAQMPFADVCIPSVFDDSLAPEGHHVVSMFTQWVPHTWSSDPDQEELDDYANRAVARMEAVAPGFTDSIIDFQVIGPHQMENEYGLVGGNIFHGELTPGQLFHARPAAGYADLRTPIRGLYQAGSSTHGGGGVTGVPGRNVVRQILSDRRRFWRRA
ncbi:MAG TPA: NAD(P)/FAD-dependent oxidoreductase [Stackebrandtia sp.]|jgi:phytoene dehydrogenase-like protein|uniref:phytoene desaturase family protein n=1 Tax=Stackebrandtia sp. TaxID=2023065 RepID=UPI002D2868B5|nr:NAD(P)/FAD-dependent oxidoreductase [Stackebrandtia sp.]HZE41480.1 NAD(P)/FAD-dependent oxidoreductase [Stackebrandtia sp.]